MRLSDVIAQFIENMLDEADGMTEIQRNELAGRFGCVPSQINYVITSRFTPEHGYIVESRRGGGGFIRIQKVKLGRAETLMHVINGIGGRIDAESARMFLINLNRNSVLSDGAAVIMAAALSDQAYREIPVELRDGLRASVFKKMLIAVQGLNGGPPG